MKCKYGCGNDAKYILKNGGKCCSKNYQSCPVNRAKNSNGCKGRTNKGHIFTNEDRKKATDKQLKKAIENAFKLNSGINNSQLKKYLLEFKNRKYECEICNLYEWNGEKLVLDLDHIDGNSMNNLESNLRFLCPNCHSQTLTYRGKNINKGSKKVSDEELIKALKKESSISKALRSVGLAGKGANYKRAYKLLSTKFL